MIVVQKSRAIKLDSFRYLSDLAHLSLQVPRSELSRSGAMSEQPEGLQSKQQSVRAEMPVAIIRAVPFQDSLSGSSYLAREQQDLENTPLCSCPTRKSG